MIMFFGVERPFCCLSFLSGLIISWVEEGLVFVLLMVMVLKLLAKRYSVFHLCFVFYFILVQGLYTGVLLWFLFFFGWCNWTDKMVKERIMSEKIETFLAGRIPCVLSHEKCLNYFYQMMKQNIQWYYKMICKKIHH